MKHLAKCFFQAPLLFLPWGLRRILLEWLFGYEIHPTAAIGFSWIFPTKLVMGARSQIGHLNVAVYLDEMLIGEDSLIGRGNWITGFPSGTHSGHFAHQPERASVMKLGRHSAITKNHHLDCTNRLSIGNFTTIAGYDSQFLTHSIDLRSSRQHSEPIQIGDYCFVGTNVVVLGGSVLPSRSVLGAKSLLQKAFQDEQTFYAGVPAVIKSKISEDARYFKRKVGYVI